MKPETAEGVFDLLMSFTKAAGLGAAMELGLFWLLAEQPMDAEGVGQALGVPGNRAGYLLQLLEDIDLVERHSEGYAPTAAARKAILDTYSQDAWAFLAREARDRFPAMCDLAIHIRRPGSVWDALGAAPPDYFAQLVENPVRARRFTRMLYQVHQVLAEELADIVDLTGVRSLLDVGGGSGVVSLAFLRRCPELSAVVIDIENVCIAGREIASAHPEGDRIAYEVADFLRDDLPDGFDLVLQCDAGVYREDFYRRLRGALNAQGRIIVVDQFAPEDGVASSPRLHWAFLSSMENANAAFPTSCRAKTALTAAGFLVRSETVLSDGWIAIEAEKAVPHELRQK